jgi:DNA polymerase-3 subunit delta'
LGLDKIDNYPYLLELLTEDKKAITISEVRQINKFLSLKISSDKDISRIIIIENAHLMRLEAQNALLKILEEPPLNSVLILESNSESLLLPTVLSRLTKIHNNPPTKEQLKSRFSDISEADFKKAYSISQNNPSLLQELLEDSEHPLYESAATARKILTGSTYDRLLMVDELSKDSMTSKNVIYILERMANISLESSDKDKLKWQKILESCYKANEAIERKAQLKLVLINLFINI